MLSFYFALLCVCKSTRGVHSSTGKHKSESLVPSADLLKTQRPLLTNEQAQGDLLQNHKERLENLPNDEQLIKLYGDEGFIKTLAPRQFLWRKMLKSSRNLMVMWYVEKYKLPRDEDSSTPKGWIRGNTKIGPVLEVVTTYYQGKPGIEIGIESLSNDGSQSWIIISKGLNKFVRYLTDKVRIHEDNEDTLASTVRPITHDSTIVENLSNKCRQTCSEGETEADIVFLIIFSNECSKSFKKWIGVQPRGQRHQSYPNAKRMNTLLRHDLFTEMKMEQLHFGGWGWSSCQDFPILKIGQVEHGQTTHKEEEDKYIDSHQILRVHLSCRMLSQLALYHYFRLIVGGKNASQDRQTVFFTAVNPLAMHCQEQKEFDLTKPPFATVESASEFCVLGRHQACSKKGIEVFTKQGHTQSFSTTLSHQSVLKEWCPQRRKKSFATNVISRHVGRRIGILMKQQASSSSSTQPTQSKKKPMSKHGERHWKKSRVRARSWVDKQDWEPSSPRWMEGQRPQCIQGEFEEKKPWHRWCGVLRIMRDHFKKYSALIVYLIGQKALCPVLVEFAWGWVENESISNYEIKKGCPHGVRHGKSKQQTNNHQTFNAWKWWRKKKMPQVKVSQEVKTGSWRNRSTVNRRKNMDGMSEAKCEEMNKLAQEDHSYTIARSELLHYSSIWSLQQNNSGRNAPVAAAGALKKSSLPKIWRISKTDPTKSSRPSAKRHEVLRIMPPRSSRRQENWVAILHTFFFNLVADWSRIIFSLNLLQEVISFTVNEIDCNRWGVRTPRTRSFVMHFARMNMCETPHHGSSRVRSRVIHMSSVFAHERSSSFSCCHSSPLTLPLDFDFSTDTARSGDH